MFRSDEKSKTGLEVEKAAFEKENAELRRQLSKARHNSSIPPGKENIKPANIRRTRSLVATRFYLVATIPTGWTCQDRRREAQPNVVNLRLKALYPLAQGNA